MIADAVYTAQLIFWGAVISAGLITAATVGAVGLLGYWICRGITECGRQLAIAAHASRKEDQP